MDMVKATGLPTPPVSPKANSHEIPREKRDWLPEAAKKSDPQGTTGINIGPSSKYWRATERGGSK
jgi:hypothetical protein